MSAARRLVTRKQTPIPVGLNTPIQASVDPSILLPGAMYEYEYKSGERIDFVFDSARPDPQNPSTGLNIYGTVTRSTRAALAPAPIIQRIARVTSIDPLRLLLITDPGRLGRTVGQSGYSTDSRPQRRVACREEHEPVNVGFMHVRMVCRICDAELGDGSVTRKTRAIGFRD